MNELKRPTPSEYASLADFLRDSVTYQKSTQPHFSVLSSCKKLRRVSPALVTLICSGKRKLTVDRVGEFAKLLKWSAEEKQFVEDWVVRMDPASQKISATLQRESQISAQTGKRSGVKKEVSVHILQDWLNVFVKDAFQIPAVQSQPDLIFDLLANLASPNRIKKSLDFLLREGYLKRTLEGRIVIDSDLAVATSPLPSQKIRNFHKAVLKIAHKSIDTVSVDRRFINTIVMPLDKVEYQEVIGIVQDFAEKLQSFSLQIEPSDSSQLYQLNLNLVPTGQAKDVSHKKSTPKDSEKNTIKKEKEISENEI